MISLTSGKAPSCRWFSRSQLTESQIRAWSISTPSNFCAAQRTLATKAVNLLSEGIRLLACLIHSYIFCFSSISMLVCLFANYSVGLFVCLSVCPSIYLPERLPTCLFVYLFVRPSICWNVCLPACLSICLPKRLPTCLFVCLPACQSVYPPCLVVFLSILLPVCLPTRPSAFLWALSVHQSAFL